LQFRHAPFLKRRPLVTHYSDCRRWRLISTSLSAPPMCTSNS